MAENNNNNAYEGELEEGIDWRDMFYLCTRK